MHLFPKSVSDLSDLYDAWFVHYFIIAYNIMVPTKAHKYNEITVISIHNEPVHVLTTI
jgi:hypothetical protein